MNIYCSNCGKEINPFWKFCSYCGTIAPPLTITVTSRPPKIDDGIFCMSCREKNIKEAQFCSVCGKDLFNSPDSNVIFCPSCGNKNKTDNRYCINCSLDFSKWTAMEGNIANELGYKGCLMLHESMTNNTYHFIDKDEITIGRNFNNDLVIPIKWISSHHCEISVTKWLIEDKDSTNGTFINKSAEKIKNINLNDVRELNLAGIFTFSVAKSKKIFTLWLTAVLDKESSNFGSHYEEINELRNHFYILFRGNGKLKIRKTDGEIKISGDGSSEHYEVKIKDHHYYFSDPDLNIKNYLIRKEKNKLPVNWGIEFQE